MNIVGVDATNLCKAIGLAEQYTKRTPAQAVATAGFFVARKTARDTHRATISNIDSKLGVSSTLAIIPSGRKNAGKPYKNRRLNVQFPDEGLTAADMIIIARMWPNSAVNAAENRRWLIDRSGFSAGGKGAFLARVRELAKAMVGQRHRSIAFLASSARDVAKAADATGLMTYRRGATPDDPEVATAAKFSDTPKGEASVRVTGPSAVFEGAMTIGGGTPDNLSERHNEAMHKYMTGPLQSAIDAEAERTMEYVAKHELEAMNGRFNAVGVNIT